jgi:hypothetical protein
MSQRASGYARRPDEAYDTPPWVAAIVANWLRGEGVSVVWEPAAGEGCLASALAVEGVEVIATHDDFFWRSAMPEASAPSQRIRHTASAVGWRLNSSGMLSSSRPSG